MVRRCGACDGGFSRQESFVDCNACLKPHHSQCSGLSDAEFDVMAIKKSKLKWFCRLCDGQVTDVLSNLEKFKKYSIEITNVRNDLKNQIENFETRLTNIEKKATPNVTAAVEKAVAEKVGPKIDSYEEQMLIERKKNNLIFFHVPESEKTDIEERMKHDFTLLRGIYKSDVPAADIINLFRVGKKSNNARPLVVRFKDSQTKEMYVAKTFGKKLTVKSNNEIINIPAAHDKTQKQREEHKKLSEELKRRRELDGNDDSDLVIRNNRIVSSFQEAPNGTKTTWANIVRNLI